MLQRDYRYISEQSPAKPQVAVIVLPEIFGPTDSIKRVADRFAKQFGVLGVVLDHFYSVDGKSQTFDYKTGAEHGIALMQRETGAGFLDFFNMAASELMAEQPTVERLVVCGFCFGGRLSYVAGVNQGISQIISFYGAGANLPNFIGQDSAIERLVAARKQDDGLRIMSFFGAQDGSIPADDRLHTRSLFRQAGISYFEKIYPTGHAYFNEDRDTYDEAAARASWSDIEKFMTQ